MAIIIFDEEIDPITGTILGNTFSNSQAGPTVRRKSVPNQPDTARRNLNNILLQQIGKFFWPLTNTQKILWLRWAQRNGVPLPFPNGLYQQAYAAYLKCLVPARMAGDPLYTTPPPDLPYAGVTFNTLDHIDKDTIRATFTPSPAGSTRRIFLAQTLPTAGQENRTRVEATIAEISAPNVTSPYDFTTRFQHLTGWTGQYFTGSQDLFGRRSSEDNWNL